MQNDGLVMRGLIATLKIERQEQSDRNSATGIGSGQINRTSGTLTERLDVLFPSPKTSKQN